MRLVASVRWFVAARGPTPSRRAPRLTFLDLAERGRVFYAAIRRYWPELRDGTLVPAYSGIRAKTTARDEKPADFVIQGPYVTGHKCYIALYGIESPGLTSSLAIGELGGLGAQLAAWSLNAAGKSAPRGLLLAYKS